MATNKTGIELEGLKRLAGRLQGLAEVARANKNPDLACGYLAEYALPVHEDLEVQHRVGEAKYLTRAVTRNRVALKDLVRQELRRGRTLTQALLTTGYALMRFSKDLVPVDTGHLRSSGYVRVDRGDPRAGSGQGQGDGGTP